MISNGLEENFRKGEDLGGRRAELEFFIGNNFEPKSNTSLSLLLTKFSRYVRCFGGSTLERFRGAKFFMIVDFSTNGCFTFDKLFSNVCGKLGNTGMLDSSFCLSSNRFLDFGLGKVFFTEYLISFSSMDGSIFFIVF